MTLGNSRVNLELEVLGQMTSPNTAEGDSSLISKVS